MPTARVWIAATAAHAMTIDAVGGWPVVVAGHARQQISSCRTTVELRRTRVATHPPYRVGTDCADCRRADSPRDMAAVTAIRGVATQTRCRPRASFDWVSYDEITHMLELPFDIVGLSLFYEQSPALLMAVRAPSLRMTGLTDIGLAGRGHTVSLEPGSIVSQEGLGHESRQFRPNVTRCAVGALEVTLVTLETLAHRG